MARIHRRAIQKKIVMTWIAKFRLKWKKVGKTTRPFRYDLNQGYGFSSSPVQRLAMDHSEGWAPKNWCFRTLCWRRLLRVPRTSRRSNQLILKEINPEYSLEGLMLKLKLQYFDLMQRTDLLEKTWCWERLRVGEGDDRGWNGWMASSTQWTWAWEDSGR